MTKDYLRETLKYLKERKENEDTIRIRIKRKLRESIFERKNNESIIKRAKLLKRKK